MSLPPDHPNDRDDDAYGLTPEGEAERPPPTYATEVGEEDVEFPSEQRFEHEELPAAPRWPMLQGVFTFPWYLSTLGVWLVLSLGVTCSGVLVLLCWLLLTGQSNESILAGAFLLMPAVWLVVLTASSFSTCALHVIENTATGYDAIRDWPYGDWREGFWSLRVTLGMLVVAWVPGWLLRRLTPIDSLWSDAAAAFLLYPVFLLGVMESNSLIGLVSLALLRTFFRRPRAWLMLYASAAAMIAGCGALAWLLYGFHKLVAVLVVGPLATAALLIYFRLLGRLAFCAGQVGEFEVEEDQLEEDEEQDEEHQERAGPGEAEKQPE